MAPTRQRGEILAAVRLEVLASLVEEGVPVAACVLDAIPVIPPQLRPLRIVDGGTRARIAHVNLLYQRAISRNNRMKHLVDLKAPPIIVDRERRMLQDCVDYLFDNAVCPDPVMSKDGSHRLRSLADLIDPPHGLLENVTFGGPTGP